MNTKLLHTFTVSLVALLLVSCSSTERTAAAPTKPVNQTILEKSYILQSVNGKKTEFARPVTMEFDKNLRIAGQICNRYTGQAELKGNLLSVKAMARTMMMCPDQQVNELETTFAKMMEAGAEITASDTEVTLKQAETTLVFNPAPAK